MKRLLTLISVLFCIVFLNGKIKGESIYAFSNVRTLNNVEKSEWLLENRWEVSRDSLLNILTIWSEELKEEKQWNDYLFIENEIANLNFLLRRAEKGVERHNKAMSSFSKFNDTISVEYSYSKLMGSQLYYYFNQEKSMRCMVELLHILEKLDHHSTYYSSSLFKTASFYLALDNRNKALELLQKLENEEELDDITRINQKAMISKLFAQTQPRFSINLMKTVIKDIESLNNKKYTGYRASYLISLGYQHDLIDDHDKADEYFKQALDVFKGSSNYSNHHICLSNLASNSIKRKEYNKAMDYLRVADSIADKHQYTQGNYRSLRMVGNMLSSMELYDSAITYYKKAENLLLDKGENYYLTTAAYVNYLIARNYDKLNNPDKAILHAKRSIWGYNGYSYKEFDDNVTLSPITNGVDYLISYPLSVYAKALESAYHRRKDLKIVDDIVNITEYVDTLLLNQMNISVEDERTIENRKNLLPVFNSSIELCTQLYLEGYYNYALKALNASESLKSRTLLFERLGYHAKSLENDSLTKIIREKEMLLLNSKSSVDSNLTQMQLTNLRNEKFNQNLDVILSDNPDGDFKRISKIDSSFLSSIPEDISLVEYHLSDTILYAFVLNNGVLNVARTPVNQFNKIIRKAFREIKTTGQLVENNKQLYEALILPIEKYLKKKTVVISDESFAFLPFELLSNEEGLLINSHTITYSYSLGLWKESQNERKPKQKSVLLVAPIFNENSSLAENSSRYRDANIDSTNNLFRGDNLVSLPFSEKEISGIIKRCKNQNINNKEFLGVDATERNVRREIGDFSIIHFATHGMVSKQDVELSGLFFSGSSKLNDYKNDGFISIKEFYNINLTADLVVLSACKSGYGKIEKGEGVISLPRSFIFNGVPNVIASLWKVHDEKTKDLMVAFYKHLLEDKVSYAEALRLAKLDCIEKGFLPLDWAGFVLIGN